MKLDHQLTIDMMLKNAQKNLRLALDENEISYVATAVGELTGAVRFLVEDLKATK